MSFILLTSNPKRQRTVRFSVNAFTIGANHTFHWINRLVSRYLWHECSDFCLVSHPQGRQHFLIAPKEIRNMLSKGSWKHLKKSLKTQLWWLNHLGSRKYCAEYLIPIPKRMEMQHSQQLEPAAAQLSSPSPAETEQQQTHFVAGTEKLPLALDVSPIKKSLSVCTA